MPGIVMKPKVLRRVKDRKKPPSRKNRPGRKNPRREEDLSPTAENPDQYPPSPKEGQTRPKKNPRRPATKKMAEGGLCKGGGAATRGLKFTRSG